jgi:para-aminobenzoate synthetase/4-amino-4-deoxychorismate lyase
MDRSTNTHLNLAVALHFHPPATESGPLFFADPIDVIAAYSIADVLPALHAVEQAAKDGRYAVGYVGYEAAPAFDPALRVCAPGPLPLLCLGIYDGPQPQTAPAQGTPSVDFDVSDWTPSLSTDEHADGVDRIRGAIAGGYTYQVNYTMRLRAAFRGDDYTFFERLRRSQCAPYAAYLNLGRYRILSASPELFFERKGGRLITRPMKGTVSRGRWTTEDDARREWLRGSEKNRAENVMIVDLLRNDVGRIARTGSVNVDELFRIEPYPTVFQMTSEISADLKPNTSLVDIFRALFPCGSVTGAPKVSTMQIIADLENEPRGVYCGAIGYVAPGGDAIFNVAIRTVVVDVEEGVAEYGTGGGITWDSDAADEYREASAKAAILTEEWPKFELLETLCLRDGEYVLPQRHLDRLMSSANYFQAEVAIGTVREKLAELASGRPKGAFRVRLLVSLDGGVTLEAYPLGDPPTSAVVAIATEPIDSNDRFLYHKTTHRAVYELHRKQFPDVFDVLLWNERDEVTEFTIGNVVVEIDGVKWTPPIECGLLPGTMRAELLNQGEVRERVIKLSELRDATRIWLVNSVRGWVRVALAG